MRFLIIGVCLSFLLGCTHTHRPLISPPYQASNYETSRPTPLSDAIQIITTRSPLFYSHSAVRILYKNQTLFWDPAGTYGLEYERPAYYKDNPLPKGFYRIEDLITQGSPNLPLYWRYSIFTGDNAMEVFEWKLTEEQAKYYYNLLYKGATQRNNKLDFITQESATICSSAVSSFLQRFGGKIIPLHEHYTLPHGLAHALHALKPDRIYYFEADNPAIIFAP